jgi:transposase
MMTDSIKKTRLKFTSAQKLEYAKLMVDENYSNAQIMELSGACSSAVVRWKKQHLLELKGKQEPNKGALNPQLKRIQELEKQLKRAQEDNQILKKATAFFIRDNPALQ